MAGTPWVKTTNQIPKIQIIMGDGVEKPAGLTPSPRVPPPAQVQKNKPRCGAKCHQGLAWERPALLTQ
jgi:hypothetical protein